MMSKKQFACMLTLHIVYLLVGAAIFYHIESPLELQQRAEDKLERLEIQNLLYEHYMPDDPDKQDTILRKLSQYCGKSMFNYTTADEEYPVKWDFYHSFFFSYTVVSTIGYGNLAPTTHLSRILMIFYGLFGIPINGILLANLGEYFGLQLITVYRKYKRRHEKRADNLNYLFTNLGLLGQIFLYLVPGFLFFIFLPSCVFVVFEGWDYIGAIYYAFVTLTTIGFGDMVAGTVNNGFAYGYFITYQLFLIVWITFGLGYIVMLLGFITSGMRSERVHKFEQKVACQLKSTQSRILQGFTRDLAVLRKVINEANLIKLKPVYVEAAPYLYRSKSCPIFTFDVEPRGPIVKRRRANSENIQLSKDILRIQSDTDLLGIDKEKTFTQAAILKPTELLARVANVLGGLEPQPLNRGVHMFDDHHILESEGPPIFTIGKGLISETPTNRRLRAQSVAVPNYRKESVAKINPDFTWSNGDTAEKYRIEANYRSGKLSLPLKVPQEFKEEESKPKSLLSRIFKKQSSVESPPDHAKTLTKGNVSDTIGSQNVRQDNKKPRKDSVFPFDFGQNEKNETDAYKEKTKKGRHSLFPTFDFTEEENAAAVKAHQKKPKRHSIFPTFDFSEDEDAAAIRAYQKKSKRHSIFPTFDFTEDEDEVERNAYKERTRPRRHSIFPTFDFSDSEEDIAKTYKEKTKKGRHSIFPTFDFSESNADTDDIIDEEEVRKYQNRTKKGRLSLFPTFGKSRKSVEEDVASDIDTNNYQKKPRRGSLFPSFGKDRKSSAADDGPVDLEASIKQYHNRTKGGRASLFPGDVQNYKEATGKGRKSLDIGKHDRPILFDPDINIAALPEAEQVEVLEQTSVADLLRALTVLEAVSPSNPQGTIESPGLIDLFSQSSSATPSRRRSSIRAADFNLPAASNVSSKTEHDDSGPRRRRISRGGAPFTPTLATVVAGAELQMTASAARENRMTMLSQSPTPESKNERETQPKARRYSPAPIISSRPATGPVPRLFSRIRRDSIASSDEESPSRRGSLTNIVIDNNKDKT